MLITTDLIDTVSARMFRTYIKFADITGITFRHVLFSKKRKCADIRHGVRALALNEYPCGATQIARAEEELKNKKVLWNSINNSVQQWHQVVKASEPEFAEMVEQLWEEAKEDE